MNNRKITTKKIEFIRTFLFLLVPYKIIAKVLNVNELTARKYTKLTKKEIVMSGPTKTQDELKFELFKLYAWSLADFNGMAMEFQIASAEIEVMQKTIFKHLNLSKFIAYCGAVTDIVSTYHELKFEDGILLPEQKLINVIFGQYTHGYEKEQNPGKKLFVDCITQIHQEQEKFMPNIEEFKRPDTCLRKVLQSFFEENRSKVGLFIPKDFLKMIKSILTNLTEKEQASFYKIFGIIDFKETFQSFAYLSHESFRQLNVKSLQRVKEELGFSFLNTSSLNNIQITWKQYVLLLLSADTAFSTLKKETEGIILRLEKKLTDTKYKLNCVTEHVSQNIKLPSDSLQERLSRFNQEQLKFLLSRVRISLAHMPVRVINTLSVAEIEYGWQLLEFGRSNLRRFSNFGKKSLYEVDDFVHSRNFTMGMCFDLPLREYFLDQTVRKHDKFSS